MVSEQIANKFLVEILEIPNWKDLFAQDQVRFLRKIIVQHLRKLPFQNISIAAEDPDIRRAPTTQEIITKTFTGKGGICMEQNYFLYLFLKSIGFKANLLSATWVGNMFQGTHLIIHVILNAQESYIVDVSSSNPLHEPIPLHKLPWRAEACGYQYEYRFDADTGLYGRWHLGGHYFKGDFEDGIKEELKLYFDLTPKCFEDFQKNMDIYYTDKDRSHMLRIPILFRYITLPEPEEDGKNFQFVGFTGTTLLQGSATERTLVKFQTFPEMEEIVEKYFGEIGSEDIQRGLKIFEGYKNQKTFTI